MNTFSSLFYLIMRGCNYLTNEVFLKVNFQPKRKEVDRLSKITPFVAEKERKPNELQYGGKATTKRLEPLSNNTII